MAVTRRILDVGNTRAKWATFDNGKDLTQPPAQLESAPVVHLDTGRQWQSTLGEHDLVMVTGSGDLAPWVSLFPEAFVLHPGDPTPLPTAVVEPERTGLDRVANAWAVLKGCCAEADPEGAWMVVDVGTCTTVDLIHSGTHWGGTISPGIPMRLDAMSQGTAHLPRPSLNDGHDRALNGATGLGSNSDRALLAGAVGGLAAEIEGKWHAWSQELPNLGVLLTGGDAHFLELRDIRPKFADAQLTLKGYYALFNHFHA